MGRLPRIVGVGYPYHVTHRGNNKQKIFFDDYDRNKYLSLLSKYCLEYNLVVLSYCLMPNHVHFIAVPQQPDSLSKTILCAHTQYSRYFGKKLGRSGHAWEGRFYSCILDERHLFSAARYVERNPVRAKMVKKAWDWPWSSAAYHIGEEKDSKLVKGDLFKYIRMEQKDWKEFIKVGGDKEYLETIREYTRRGLPLGDRKFIEKWHRKSGIILHRRW
ncbi:MAG: transposase [Candidatus Saganbacteria bacterium]|nr:transposase [Candidatus Saganbacteria bacterium]